MKLAREKALPIIMNALTEDMGSGDITSNLLFEKDVNVTAEVVVKEECIICGIDVAKWIFNVIDERIILRPLCNDGDRLKKGKKVISLKGHAKGIMSGERSVLNFLGRLSGVATLTHRFIQKAKTKKVKIFDTRKTTPGLRVLEKYAVRVGGGYNHRMGLWDGILIKDNHLVPSGLNAQGFRLGGQAKLSVIEEAVRKVKARGYKDVEIEINNLKEFREALEAGADIIMLDNMKLEDVRKAVRFKRSKVRTLHHVPILEASGGVVLENVGKIAAAGVDRISIGSLTHSVPTIDFSLEICK